MSDKWSGYSDIGKWAVASVVPVASFQKPHLSPTDRVAGFAAVGKPYAISEDLWSVMQI
jgi:hypothetical protein